MGRAVTLAHVARRTGAAARQSNKEIFVMSSVSPKYWWISFVVLLGIAPTLFGQRAAGPLASSSINPGGESYPPPPYYGFGGRGYGGMGGGYGWGMNGVTGGIGSTAAGSYLGGLGMAIRAKGQYNLLTSEAAVNLTEARKRQMENQLQWTNTYFEKRRINKAYRDAERGPPPTQQDWVRMAHEAAPKRLEDGALDPVTGQIDWPTALRADIFAQDREQLDQLFAERAHTDGAVGLDMHSKIQAAVDSTMAKLKSHIRDLDANKYLQARSFLTGLAREADFSTS
jgi:hypothetical protein